MNRPSRRIPNGTGSGGRKRHDARVREAIVQRAAIGSKQRGKESGTKRHQRYGAGQGTVDGVGRVDRSMVIADDADAGSHLSDGLAPDTGKRREIRELQQPEESSPREKRQRRPLAHRQLRNPEREIEHGGVDRQQNAVIDRGGEQTTPGRAGLGTGADDTWWT